MRGRGWGVWAPAALKLAVCLATLRGYGVFRDELYYLACPERLDLGYVDHAALVAWITAGVRAVFGPSVPALRALSALLGSATVVATGALCARPGGGTPARLVACTSFVVAPVFLVMNHIWSMNAIEPLL